MKPTCELRFLRRHENGNQSTYERTILQQKWAHVDPDGTTVEQWRDVPLVIQEFNIKPWGVPE